MGRSLWGQAGMPHPRQSLSSLLRAGPGSYIGGASVRNRSEKEPKCQPGNEDEEKRVRKQPCKHPGQERRRNRDFTAAWGEEHSRAGTLQGPQAAAGKNLVFPHRNCGPWSTHTGTGVKGKEGRCQGGVEE